MKQIKIITKTKLTPEEMRDIYIMFENNTYEYISRHRLKNTTGISRKVVFNLPNKKFQAFIRSHYIIKVREIK